jgi:hypothetical protein
VEKIGRERAFDDTFAVDPMLTKERYTPNHRRHRKYNGDPRQRHLFDRLSVTGQPFKTAKGGAGKGNWGTPLDDINQQYVPEKLMIDEPLPVEIKKKNEIIERPEAEGLDDKDYSEKKTLDEFISEKKVRSEPNISLKNPEEGEGGQLENLKT